ncbi:MAG: MerR family transcriptional regulator, partial [Bacteroidetes bacterium]|nr:MerR family transcriptional regulator [Bacteroidota bacterium]
MGQYSIKDIEILSGIKAHTLRIWEQRYNIVEPNRTDTNIRFYSDEQLKTILNVSVLNNCGFKISKIAQMSPAEMAKEILKLDIPAGNHDNLIHILVDAMITMDKASALQVLNKADKYNSLQEFFSMVIFPFLNRVGMLWATNG